MKALPFSFAAAAWIFISVFPPPCAMAKEPNEKQIATLIKVESLGGIKLNQPAAGVERVLGVAESRSKAEQSEVSAEWAQDWSYPSKGLEVRMSSEKNDGKGTVLAVTASGKSTAATARGIKLGSTEEEVRKAYADVEVTHESETGKSFVAGGSMSGIVFTFKHGKVVEILLTIDGC